MKDITIIIPVYFSGDPDYELLDRSISSAKKVSKTECPIVLIGEHKLVEKYSEDKDLTIIENNDNTDFCSQVNMAVSKISTKFFSVLELDDRYYEKWFDNFEKYYEKYSDVSAFLPLIEAINFTEEEKGPVSYINEPAWASSFSEVIGFLDTEAVNNYPGFNMTGAIINKDDFENVGGLKPSIKISFWYEFLLRFLNKDKKAYVIPKVGYFHYFNRPGSLTDEYHKTIDENEANWWMQLAQQEYLFKKDRNKTYEE